MISLGFFRLAVGKSCSFKVGFGILLVSIGEGKEVNLRSLKFIAWEGNGLKRVIV